MSDTVLYIDPHARYADTQREALAKFNATGLSRYTGDGRLAWAEYTATIQRARKAEIAYLGAHYPNITSEQAQEKLAAARAGYRDAIANNGDVELATNQLQRTYFWLWGTPFLRVEQEIEDGTIGLGGGAGS